MIRSYWPFIVPLVFLLLLALLMAPDRLGHARIWTHAHRCCFDDYDAAAYLLRALNASGPRSGGRPDEPLAQSPDDFSDSIDHDSILADRYFLEYPHLMLWIFQLAGRCADLPSAAELPPALLDATQHDLVWHVPRDAAERAWWAAFRRGIWWSSAIGMALMLGNLAVLRWGFRTADAPIMLLILPASLYFALNRMDVLPSLFVLLALSAVWHDRPFTSGVCLAIGALCKVYPILLGPLLLRYWLRRSGAARSFLLGGFGTGMFILLMLVVMYGGREVLAPYRFQLSREPLPGWTLYGIVLPNFLGDRSFGVLRLAIVFVVMLGLTLRPISKPRDIVRSGIIVLLVFANLQVFYSPQWVWWFLPLLVILASVERRWIGWVIAFDVLTYLSFPIVFDHAEGTMEMIARPLLVWARAVLSVWLMVRLWCDSVGED